MCLSVFLTTFLLLNFPNLNTIVFLYPYLKCRKQNIKINHVCSAFEIIISCVPQGYILRSILFFNDLVFALKRSNLYNFADDNTITVVSENVDDLLQVLQQEAETAIK